jgi:outer membrane protein assembly factor BamA
VRSVLVLACLARLALAQPSTPTPTPTPDSAPAAGAGSGSGSDATAGSGAPLPPPAPVPAAPAPVTPAVGFGPTANTTTESAATVEARHAALALCVARDPTCDWVATFSSLERQSIVRTLQHRGLEVEPAPWGKVIEQVVVENEDVFAEENWLQFFNIFHYTTRERRVREELTIQKGEVWDQARVEESARRLHDPLYSSVVALIPVRSSIPGAVKLLVVTRDIWSLRLNTQYTFQQSALTNLSFSLSENNFLGTRDVLAAAVVMDPGAIAVGPLFIDKDFLARHLDFRVRFDEVLTRKATKFLSPVTGLQTAVPGAPQGLQDATTLHSEGADATITLSKPLWSLASTWGWGTSFTYRNAINRSFDGRMDPYDLYVDPDSGVPFEYRSRTWSVSANGVRQWGTTYKHQVSFGYTVSSARASLLDNYSANLDAAALALFEQDVFPRDEVISQPFVGYTVYQPRYKTIRNVSTYELAEDVQLGPSFSASVAQGLTALGGDLDFTRPTITAGYIWSWLRDGFIHPSASGSLRFQSSAPHDWTTIDNNAAVQLRFATPTIHWFRIVVQGDVATQWHNTQNAYYAIGSDSGLRGYNLNEFRSPRNDSSRLAKGDAELRTTPVPWWVLRLGAVAFYEVGGAADSLQQMKLYNDVGVGVRLLVPQTSRELFRLDIALPLQSAPSNPAFHPHFIAGFDSYF